MNQIVTTGIVLSRTDFQEADRIVTLLTPDQGKIRVIARGVRKATSKLAGGIELFSVNNVTVLRGRGEIRTLVSARLKANYGNIIKKIDRTMLGYELLKRLNRVTEDAAGPEYFDLLQLTLEGLNDVQMSNDLIEFWFGMQLLKITGHAPNLKTDTLGQALDMKTSYQFDVDEMAFAESAQAMYASNHIKLMRLAIVTESPSQLAKIKDADKFLPSVLALSKATLNRHLRL